jgi:hypothetical protein
VQLGPGAAVPGGVPQAARPPARPPRPRLGSSGRLDEARRIAEGLDPGTVLERLLLYWSGEWEQAEAAWSAARDRDERASDRHADAVDLYRRLGAGSRWLAWAAG